jgi:tRNA A37 N6-isopentenylltransferase MiaA
MNRQPSLRRRLLLAGGVGLLLVSLLASALLGELFKRSARDRLDHELQQDMLTLLAQAEVDPDGQLRLRQEPNDALPARVLRCLLADRRCRWPRAAAVALAVG